MYFLHFNIIQFLSNYTLNLINVKRTIIYDQKKKTVITHKYTLQKEN